MLVTQHVEQAGASTTSAEVPFSPFFLFQYETFKSQDISKTGFTLLSSIKVWSRRGAFNKGPHGCLGRGDNTEVSSSFCKLCGIKTKEDGSVHMKQLCYPPAPICPSTDSILQLDIILPHRQGEEEKEEEEEERWDRGKQNRLGRKRRRWAAQFQLSQRLRRRKWRWPELGHEWDEIRGGDAGALLGTTSN